MKCNSANDLYDELKNIAREISLIRGNDVNSQTEENSMNLFQ